jgi:hypothetical protein
VAQLLLQEPDDADYEHQAGARPVRPAHDAEEVGFLFGPGRSVNRDTERSHGLAGVGGSQLGVLRQTPNQDDSVKHVASPPSL